MLQSKLNAAIGNVQHWKQEQSTLTFYTDIAIVRVRLWQLGAWQVQVTQQHEFNDFTYAIDQPFEDGSFELEQVNELLLLKTKEGTLEINLKPFRVRLLNTSGNPLVEEDPAFGSSWIGQQVFHYRKLQPNEKFIGLGEKTERLNRAGRAYTNWNTDHFGYKDGSDPLYASIPFFMGVHSNGAYGIFYDNSHKSEFNFGASNNRFSFYTSYDGELNYYLFTGENPLAITQKYTALTGRTQMPPRWSLGLQQCRYSYYPEAEVRMVAQNYRSRQIPADVIYLDIHYMDGFKVFTWHPSRFPDPKKLMADLAEQGFKVVTIMDPGIKVEDSYHAYQSGIGEGIFVNYPDGTPWTAMVWPGWCHFPDFTSEKGRAWWAHNLKAVIDAGIAGFWTDMNEPASWGQHTPPLIEFNQDGHKASFNEAHNVYGMQMARATYDGNLKHQPSKRPFVLSRAGYAGIQRYAALWTGDNQATNDHMLLGVRMLSSLGMSGVAFAGMDVGGFEGEVNPPTYARWVSVGTFSPMFRIHTMINNRDTEPWALGETTETIARNYINLRYRLLSYLYSCFYQNSTDGTPIQRSLALEYAHEEDIYDVKFENQFFFGPHLMVAPVAAYKEFTKVYFPGEGSDNFYYNLWTDEPYLSGSTEIVESPLHLLPVFAKPGAIIPLHKSIQHTSEDPGLELELHIYHSEETTNFTWYYDAGEGFGYKSGEYALREIELTAESLSISPKDGSYEVPFKWVKIMFHGFENIKALLVNGKEATLQPEKFTWLAGLPNFDPLGPDLPVPYVDVVTTQFEFLNDAIQLNWQLEE